ncbi:hypothetical protein QR680_000286 [Steinernema hermaphroditum]|uniref:Uncharacterized protein n=1 Tax=Steinernema hermaphroditum TaxID=289476 RepID=A0AA39GU38_9BILA|nr:hypothetical protein QR680_000286 [Steinernema hermaphroditum]
MDTVPVAFIEAVLDVLQIGSIKRKPCSPTDSQVAVRYVHDRVDPVDHGLADQIDDDDFCNVSEENLECVQALKLTGNWQIVAKNCISRTFISVAMYFNPDSEHHVHCFYRLWNRGVSPAVTGYVPLQRGNILSTLKNKVLVEFHFAQCPGLFSQDRIAAFDLRNEEQNKKLEDFLNSFQWNAVPRMVFYTITHCSIVMERLMSRVLNNTSTIILRNSSFMLSYLRNLPRTNFNPGTALETEIEDLCDITETIEKVNVEKFRFGVAKSKGMNLPEEHMVDALSHAWRSRVQQGYCPQIAIEIINKGISFRIAEETVSLSDCVENGNYVVRYPVSAEYEWDFSLVDYDNAQITTFKRK